MIEPGENLHKLENTLVCGINHLSPSVLRLLFCSPCSWPCWSFSSVRILVFASPSRGISTRLTASLILSRFWSDDPARVCLWVGWSQGWHNVEDQVFKPGIPLRCTAQCRSRNDPIAVLLITFLFIYEVLQFLLRASIGCSLSLTAMFLSRKVRIPASLSTGSIPFIRSAQTLAPIKIVSHPTSLVIYCFITNRFLSPCSRDKRLWRVCHNYQTRDSVLRKIHLENWMCQPTSIMEHRLNEVYKTSGSANQD